MYRAFLHLSSLSPIVFFFFKKERGRQWVVMNRCIFAMINAVTLGESKGGHNCSARANIFSRGATEEADELDALWNAPRTYAHVESS